MIFCLKIRSLAGKHLQMKNMTRIVRIFRGVFLEHFSNFETVISRQILGISKKRFCSKLFTIMYNKLWVPQLGNAYKSPNQEPPKICGAPLHIWAYIRKIVNTWHVLMNTYHMLINTCHVFILTHTMCY